RAQLVGLAVYEKAGGLVERDLFGKDVYLPDVGLLDRLVEEKLQAEAAKLQKEGWKWAEVAKPNESIYEAVRPYGSVRGEKTLLPPDVQAERDALEKEYAQLEEAITPHPDDNEAEEEYIEDLDDEQEFDDEEDDEGEHHVPPVAKEQSPEEKRLEEISARLEEIDEIEQHVEYRPEVKKAAGVILAIGYNGEIERREGLIRKEDQVAIEEAVPNFKQAVTRSSKPARGPYAANLVESLTQHKTAAIQAELAGNEHVALATTVYSLLLSVKHDYS